MFGCLSLNHRGKFWPTSKITRKTELYVFDLLPSELSFLYSFSKLLGEAAEGKKTKIAALFPLISRKAVNSTEPGYIGKWCFLWTWTTKASFLLSQCLLSAVNKSQLWAHSCSQHSFPASLTIKTKPCAFNRHRDPFEPSMSPLHQKGQRSI